MPDWIFDPPTYHCSKHPTVNLTKEVKKEALESGIVVGLDDVPADAPPLGPIPGDFLVEVECPGPGKTPEDEAKPHTEACQGTFHD